MIACETADIRIGEGRQNPEIVLAGEEDLAVLELYLDYRIGDVAHSHRVVAEQFVGRIAVRLSVQVPVAGLIQLRLEVEHQIHDHVLELVVRGLGGGERHLTDDLLRAEVHPEHQGHIVRQDTVVVRPVGVEIVLVRQDRQSQQAFVLGLVLDLEMALALKDDMTVLFHRPEHRRVGSRHVIPRANIAQAEFAGIDRGITENGEGRTGQDQQHTVPLPDSDELIGKDA